MREDERARESELRAELQEIATRHGKELREWIKSSDLVKHMVETYLEDVWYEDAMYEALR